MIQGWARGVVDRGGGTGGQEKGGQKRVSCIRQTRTTQQANLYLERNFSPPPRGGAGLAAEFLQKKKHLTKILPEYVVAAGPLKSHFVLFLSLGMVLCSKDLIVLMGD